MDIFPLTPFELTLSLMGILLIGYSVIILSNYGGREKSDDER